MPLYEYQCDACSHRFERIQKFSDPHVDTCPSCGGTVKKLLSSPAIQFKGSGWYITDYAKKSSGDSGKGSGSAGDRGKDSGSTSSSSSGDTSASSSTDKGSTSTDKGSSSGGSSGSSSSSSGSGSSGN
jgi:putative FmdB family regulatory protein